MYEQFIIDLDWNNLHVAEITLIYMFIVTEGKSLLFVIHTQREMYDTQVQKSEHQLTLAVVM